MTDRELLELIAAQVGKLTTKVDKLAKDNESITIKVDKLTTDVASITTKTDRIDKTVAKIESEHSQKLSALFDGHKQNADKLDRIEKEVSKHEEIILRRIR